MWMSWFRGLVNVGTMFLGPVSEDVMAVSVSECRCYDARDQSTSMLWLLGGSQCRYYGFGGYEVIVNPIVVSVSQDQCYGFWD